MLCCPVHISPENIFRGLQRDGTTHTFAEAEAINRDLAASLNRDYDFNRTSLKPDVSGELSLGNSWYLGEGEDWQVGALAVVACSGDPSSPATPSVPTGVTVTLTSLTHIAERGLDQSRDRFDVRDQRK